MKKVIKLKPIQIQAGKGKKCGCVLISIDEVCVTDLNVKIKMVA